MAGGMDVGQGGKGGKKPLDVAINLVPFIDLMAVTISFLIMTAVWTQIGRLQVAQSGPSDSAQTDPNEKPPPEVRVLASPTEVRLVVDNVDSGVWPMDRSGPGGKLNLAPLAAKLAQVRTDIPLQQTVIVTPNDKLKYEDLVRLIDEASGAKYENVSVEAEGQG